jgi:hypothetical protein
MGEDKNKFRAFTDKYTPPWVLVTIFVLLALFGLSRESDAAELQMGPTYLSGETSSGAFVLLREDYGKYSFGIGLTSPQKCRCRTETVDIDTNAYIQAERNIRVYERFSVSIGASYWNRTSRVNGSHFAFPLTLRFDINDRLSIGVRHWSNAGSARPNLGQDAIYIGWRL